MILDSWGGAVTRCVFRLAPILFAGLVISGCGRAVQPVGTTCYVDMKSLVQLHPSWREVQSIQQQLDGIAAFNPQGNPVPMTNPAPEKPFSLPPPVSRGVVIQRQKPIEDYVMRYLKQRAEAIRQRNAKRIARQERIEARNRLIQLAAARKKLQDKLTSEHLIKANTLDRELTRLGYRDIALQSQIKAYSGQGLKDALAQRQIIQTKIASKNEERSQLLSDVLPEVEQQLEPQKIALEQQSRVRINTLKAALDVAADKLEQAAANQNSSAAQDLMPDSESIPAIGSGKTNAPLKQAHPLSVVLANPSPIKFVESANLARNSIAQERACWEARRDSLTAIIQQEVQHQVELIARQNRWKLADKKTLFSSDCTALMAAKLRKAWSTGASQ